VRLFERSRRGVVLNAAGAGLLDEARDLLIRAARAAHVARSARTRASIPAQSVSDRALTGIDNLVRRARSSSAERPSVVR
jgi:DNA-binding transcriptional LysR family regulator